MRRNRLLPHRACVIGGPLLAIGSAACACWGQTTTNGSSLAFRSSGAAGSGSSWVLSENGYVGTYVTLPAPGPVTFAVDAFGATAGGAAPRMNLVVNDSSGGWDVAATSASYSTTLNLPAGTHFVRTEFVNDVPTASRSLTVQNLRVTGATVANSNTNANALAASDTYIENYRKGPADVRLIGAAPGTAVQVSLRRHAFSFGGNVPGGTNNVYLTNPQFAGFFRDHFNAVVPSRAGKWSNNEAVRDTPSNNTVTMGYVDAILDFAEAGGMRARMHALIWGNTSTTQEQPTWAVNMLNNPTATDPVTGLSNTNALRQEISERIDYYVGDGPGGLTDFAPRYGEVDVYNESWHTGSNTPGTSNNYWDRLGGAAGIAGIYEEVAHAAAQSGANTKLFVNEFNVFQFAPDAYGNWYRNHIESIQNADGDPTDGPVSGVGIQYYVLPGHTASAMQQALQGLSVTSLPLSLTEFGVQEDVTDPLVGAQMLEESMRMTFGTPDASAFLIWGWWAGATDEFGRGSVLVDENWNLTPVGERYEALMELWDTELQLVVGPDGTIDFNGFFGDYDVIINGQAYPLELLKGTTQYTIVVPEPAVVAAFAIITPLLAARRRRVA